MEEQIMQEYSVEDNVFDQKKVKKGINTIECKYFVGFIITTVIQIIVILMLNKFLVISDYSGDLIFALEMLPFMFIGYPIFIYIVKRTPKNIELERTKMTIGQILCAFLTSYAILYVFNIIGGIVTTALDILVGGSTSNVVFNLVNTTSVPTQLLIGVILAPIFEEYIYRKLLIDRIAGYSEKAAVLVSATLFACVHGNLSQGIYAFGLGAFFAAIYVKTANVKYTIILHMMVNFMGTVVAGTVVRLLDFNKFREAAGSGDANQIIEFVNGNVLGITVYAVYTIIILCAVIAGIVLFAVNHKKLKLNVRDTDIPKGKMFNTVFLNVGMLLCVLFLVGMTIYTYIS